MCSSNITCDNSLDTAYIFSGKFYIPLIWVKILLSLPCPLKWSLLAFNGISEISSDSQLIFDSSLFLDFVEFFKIWGTHGGWEYNGFEWSASNVGGKCDLDSFNFLLTNFFLFFLVLLKSHVTTFLVNIHGYAYCF